MSNAASPDPSRRRAYYAFAIVALQALAAAYFVVDGIEDILAELRTSVTPEVMLECLVAFALLAGVVLGVRYAQALMRDAERHELAMLAAQGAMSELVAQRFREWGLSRSEAEVALFALKGSSITEIAAMRHAAEGTVRSQLSQVYAKAGVKNQSMLIAQFIDELVDPLLPAV